MLENEPDRDGRKARLKRLMGSTDDMQPPAEPLRAMTGRAREVMEFMIDRLTDKLIEQAQKRRPAEVKELTRDEIRETVIKAADAGFYRLRQDDENPEVCYWVFFGWGEYLPVADGPRFVQPPVGVQPDF